MMQGLARVIEVPISNKKAAEHPSYYSVDLEETFYRSIAIDKSIAFYKSIANTKTLNV